MTQNADRKSAMKVAVQTALGVTLSLLVWLAVYFLFFAFLRILDIARGQGNNLIEIILKEVFAAGVGGYTAIYTVKKLFAKANIKICFGTLIFLVLILTLGSHVFLLYMSEVITYTWGEQILRWVCGASAIIGACVAYSNIMNK